MARGLVHIYCGDGKGKTTASIGLSLRAAGAGLRVLYVQFFKDGSSSEFRLLEQAGVTFLRPAKKFGFYRTLTPQQREEARAFYTEHFRTAAAMAGDFDLLVLDEAMSACRTGVVPEEEVLAFLQSRPERLETSCPSIFSNWDCRSCSADMREGSSLDSSSSSQINSSVSSGRM